MSRSRIRLLHGFSSSAIELMHGKAMKPTNDNGFVLPKKYSIVPLITAGLSLLASYIILREVIVDLRNGNGNAISRLLLSMSIAGSLFSLGTLMSTFASPSELEYLHWNIGTIETCDIQGFLLTLGFTASPLLVLALSYFYLLVIRYDFSDIALLKVECGVHSAIWLIALVISTVPLVMGMYNNDLESCWITEAPYQCAHVDSAVECERGLGASDYAHLLAFIPHWPCMTMCIFAVAFLYWTVHNIGDCSGSPSMSMDVDPVEHFRFDNKDTEGNCETIDQQLSKSVAMQATFYILVFLVTNGSHLITSMVDICSGRWHQPSQFFAFAVCMPLQGFFNCCVFMRRREMQTAEGRLFRWIICCRGGSQERTISTGNMDGQCTGSRRHLSAGSSRFFHADEDGTEKLNQWSY